MVQPVREIASIASRIVAISRFILVLLSFLSCFCLCLYIHKALKVEKVTDFSGMRKTDDG